MKAEIISIGTELLMGELTDTNSPFIASRLPSLGMEVRWVSQVGDDLDALAEAFTRGLGRADIIFTTGGLGPTQDDLTREAISKALGEEMVVREDLMETLKGFFLKRGTDMPASNIKQATLIPSASSIPNLQGTAPGWWVESKGKVIVAMPGPPGELQSMWEAEVGARLRGRGTGAVILTRNIKTTGLSEGAVDEMVSAYLGNENPYLGIYAKSDGIHLRIIASAATEEAVRGLIAPVEWGLTNALGPYIWGYDDDTPEAMLGEILSKKHLTLATMESLTGGLVASSISNVLGSDGYFVGGVVIHSNGSAIASGVPLEVVQAHGTVSQEAAGAMALAAARLFEADIGVGVTGVAGPEEIKDKPVGTVHVAVALPTDGLGKDNVHYFSSRLPPRREVIIRRAVSTALVELRRLLVTP